MQKKKGISLIVLVITIIVMIILAAAIILSLNNAGIIGNANKAVSETNEATIVEFANLTWGEAYVEGKMNQKLMTANYFQNKIEEAFEKNKIDISGYEIIAGEDGVRIFKKDDWEFAYIASNTEWNDTKIVKGEEIPEDAKIVVKFYKTENIIIPNDCPNVSGNEKTCEERQNMIKNNEYYMIIEGSGVVPDLCKSIMYDSSTEYPDYAYLKGIGNWSRTMWAGDDIYELFGAEEDKEVITSYVTHTIVKEGITGIGKATFNHLYSLTDVILPNTLTKLGNGNRAYVFWANNIENLVIPASVTNLETGFEGNGVKNIYVETTSLTEIGEYKSFKGTIYVRNEAMKTLFESKIDSSKATVSSNFNW